MLPVTPSKLQIKIENKNDTITLINDGEVNFLKKAGLSTVEFEVLLPNVNYPFAVYTDGFKKADFYLKKLSQLKTDCKPFRFIVTREQPNGIPMFSTNLNVSLEEYTIKEDAKNGIDILASIKLKQYRDFGTKTCKISLVNSTQNVVATGTRETTNSPLPTTAQVYTVVKGDCLWNIAKKFYGNGAKYTIIAEANKNIIKSPNLIHPGDILTIPAL